MLGFERRRSINDFINTGMSGITGELDADQQERLNRIKRAWNFYEGYHWEELPRKDSAEITINYCRAFVDKFVAFELGKAFTFTTNPVMEGVVVTPDGRTLFEYLEDVWEDNEQYALCTELGQMKSVTGEAWLQVSYVPPEDLEDPFGEYPDGRLRVTLVPTSTVFPEYDPHDRSKLVRLSIIYQYEDTRLDIFGRSRVVKKIYKQIWTKDKCQIFDGSKEPEVIDNKYGVIPFVLIRNLNIAGRTDSRNDLEDIIPLNTEFNLRSSNVSEILDYHASPVTIVYGAKIGNLEKGANKLWGGLPKDAKVENLELRGDLGASNAYQSNLKLEMCEVGGIPETVLGGAQAISNTSGVALQYINLPLIEKTRVKRMNTETGLETLNKLILLVSVLEGLIRKPDNVETREFLKTEVTIPDTLPKDTLLELQQAQLELQMGIESRRNIMKRLGKENIDVLIEEIDSDMKQMQENQAKLNSGFLNSETPIEQVRKETTGVNGGGE